MQIHHVPFRGVGAGDFCPLYPDRPSVPAARRAAPGTQFPQMPRGAGPGPVLLADLGGEPQRSHAGHEPTPPGNSYTYVNPDDDTDWLLSAGDWVKGASGNDEQLGGAGAARRAPRPGDRRPRLVGNPGQGNNFQYKAQDFVRVRLLAYQLTGQGWLSFEFLGFASCFNRPPTVDAGPDRAITVPPGVASLAGSVERRRAPERRPRDPVGRRCRARVPSLSPLRIPPRPRPPSRWPARTSSA